MGVDVVLAQGFLLNEGVVGRLLYAGSACLRPPSNPALSDRTVDAGCAMEILSQLGVDQAHRPCLI